MAIRRFRRSSAIARAGWPGGGAPAAGSSLSDPVGKSALCWLRLQLHFGCHDQKPAPVRSDTADPDTACLWMAALVTIGGISDRNRPRFDCQILCRRELGDQT